MLRVARQQIIGYGIVGLALAAVLLISGWLFLSVLLTTESVTPPDESPSEGPWILGLHAVSDLLIGLSYTAISAMLVYLVYRARGSIPFHWVFLLFGLFIVACGGTHFMHVVRLWTPAFWPSATIQALTTIASLGTAVALPPLLPRILALVQSAKLSEERRVKLVAQNRELEELNERLMEFDRLKTQFFANVSHELRTPLTLILGPTTKLLTEDGLSEQQRHDLEVVERNARTLLRHVNDLLDISKVEAGRMTVNYTEVDLAQLVRVVSSHFQTLVEERRISFSVEAPPSVPAQADPEKLQRVLLNLISNAFKFTPDGGKVRFALRAEGERVIAEIGDSGPGVEPALREAIFERFQQGDGDATRRFGGTGLGLSITKDFVELHGGTIEVSDAPEGGARFKIELPLVAPLGVEVRTTAVEESGDAEEITRQAMEELRPRSNGTGSAATQDGERPLVLIVEDNPEMNRFISGVLTPDYRTAAAFDGQEGLEQALALHPDLILSDMMMPRMSGDRMVREVRNHPELDSVPVVGLTARADEALRVQLLRHGAQDYLVKPFLTEELQARVGNLIEVKRTRDLLQRELESQSQNVATLANEISLRNRELKAALQTLEERMEELARSNAELERFAYIASHDLQEPLRMVSSYTQLLARRYKGRLDEDADEFINYAVDGAKRMQGLINGLLAYSRLGTRGKELVPTDTQRVFEAAHANLRMAIEESGAEVTSGELPTIIGDKTQLGQLFQNLIGNALKFRSEGPVKVIVEAERRDGECLFWVQDNGIGIEPQHLERIFLIFQRLHGEGEYSGTGIGLAVCKKIVERHGGRIWAESEPGKGSTFYFTLPALK